MANIESIVQDLKREREQLDQAIRALTSLTGNARARAARSGSMAAPKRRLSAAARARIAAAQRARWAKVRAKKA